MKRIIALVLAMLMLACAFASCGVSAARGTLTGFDVELAAAVAEKLELKVEFLQIEWSNKEAALADKKIDCIWNGMSSTAERDAAMELSLPYLSNKQVAVIRIEDAEKYTSLESLSDAVVTAEKGSTAEGLIVSVDADAKETVNIGTSYKSARNQLETLFLVSGGNADVAIVDGTMAAYTLEKDSNLGKKLMVVETINIASEEYVVACRKDSGLAAMIDWALVELTKSGKVAEIAAKYGLVSQLLITSEKTVPTTLSDAEKNLTDAEKVDWARIQGQGKIVIGYTQFAPIAFLE